MFQPLFPDPAQADDVVGVGVFAGLDGSGGETEGFAVFEGGRVEGDEGDGYFVAEFDGLQDFEIEAGTVGIGDRDDRGTVQIA